MPIKISMRKRRAKEGEIGLFVDAQIFEEEWSAFKIDSDVDVTATSEAHAKYNRFSWHLARLVKDGTGQFNHTDDARDAILKLCRHVEDVWDNLRGQMTVKVKPTHTLGAEEWVRLTKRMAWYAEHTFGIPPEEISRSPYASKAPPPETKEEYPPTDYPEKPQTTADPDKPREPQTEAEYIASCKAWLAKQTDASKHWPAREYFDGEAHVAMRQRIGVKLGVRKMLQREIDEHFEKLKNGGDNGGQD